MGYYQPMVTSKYLTLFFKNSVLRPSLGKLCLINCRNSHYIIQQAGNREQVGYGVNGGPAYGDTPAFPFPSVRWKEPTPEICCLWEKQKGDWSALTREEKKELYRASFRQTYAEFHAPHPQWKFIAAAVLWAVSFGFWLSYLATLTYPDLPDTFSDEKRAAQLSRMIDSEVNPIMGLSSKWDYEKGCWKY